MINVLMPTRGRPQQALQAWQSFSSSRDTTRIVWVLDPSDPAVDGYHALATEHAIPYSLQFGNMVTATNRAWPKTLLDAVIADLDMRGIIIGWAADDQLVRTPDWDLRIYDAFADNIAFVQTNDLHYGPEKAANIFVRADVVIALNYLALPTLDHLYVDDAWVALGRASNRLAYLPDVHIEHMHPVYNKGKWDEHYEKVNIASQYAKDNAAYETWLRDGLVADVAKVNSCFSR